MNFERTGHVLVCRAGTGEWYNQPHKRRWDMGEDAAEIPPAQWHVEVQRIIEAQDSRPRHIVVDVSAMDRLVGQDWGFLVRLQEYLSEIGSVLSVVASERMVQMAEIMRLKERLRVRSSMEALSFTV